jgi:hypothetical protein
MAKPVSVPENEALKYYRIKNLITPPEAFELSDLDKEMSNVLSRTDLSSKEKAFQYYRALTKFRNLFKSFVFPSVEELSENESIDSEQIFDGNYLEEKDSIVKEKESEEKKKEEAEEQEEDSLDNDDIPSPPSTKTPRSPPPHAKYMTGLDIFGKAIQENIDEQLLKRKIAAFNEKGVSFKAGTELKTIPLDVWVTTLNFLGSDKFQPMPVFGKAKQRKIQDTKAMAAYIWNARLIDKQLIENFPNLASQLESQQIRKSTTPETFAPPLDPFAGKGKKSMKLSSSIISGHSPMVSSNKKVNGVKVNFKAWNNHIFQK